MTDTYPKSTTWPHLLAVLVAIGAVLVPSEQWTRQWHRLRQLQGLRFVENMCTLSGDVRLAIAATRGHRRSSGAPIRHHGPAETKSNGKTPAIPLQTLLPKPSPSRDARPIQPLLVEPEPPVANRVLPQRPEREFPPRESTEDPEAGPPAQSPGGRKAADPDTAPPLPADSAPGGQASTEAVPANQPPLAEESLDRRRWPRSERLHELLDSMGSDPALVDWAASIRELLEQLEHHFVDGGAESRRLIQQLGKLSVLPRAIFDLPYHRQQAARRLSYAIDRRADTWQALLAVAVVSVDERRQQAIEQLRRDIVQFQNLLAETEHASTWNEYLGIAELQEQLRMAVDFESIVTGAEQRLRRMQLRSLTAPQRRFLNAPVPQQLAGSLARVVAASVSPGDLVNSLESYETHPNRVRAGVVVDQLNCWQSPAGLSEYLPAVQAISTHYRNANLRFAISEELLNRFVPAASTFAERVSDTILGAEVRGSNATSTALSVDLVPDSQRIRVQLEARGQVKSNTSARKGPITMYNRGQSTFSSDKQLVVQPDGIYTTRAQTAASGGTRLVGMKSDLDDVPLIGWIVRAVARQQHDEQRSQARAEMMRRVQRSASEKMDREVHERMSDVERRVNRRLLQPLKRLELDPRALEMRTTEDRVVMRSRLASPNQLGAHTPRPLARKDSMLSLQVHQTAANNLIEQLHLHGRRLTLEELFDSLSEKLGMVGLDVPDENHKDVVVQFAAHHPLECEFEHGQITLTIHLAELDNGNRTWRNFSVRGYYRADVDQLDVELVRDGGIELISERLGLRDQLALRGIFTKVLARNHRLQILRQAIAQQPKLQGLEVMQLTIRDGWVGLAFGENPSGIRMVDRPTPPQR